MTDQLLDTQDIANVYRVSYKTARDTITKHPAFPARVPGSSSKKPLWLRSQVEAYMMGKKDSQMTHA